MAVKQTGQIFSQMKKDFGEVKHSGTACMKVHVPQLDYLKCVFIILMILFHLVYIGDSYPYIKKMVYTFHMPIFLILSGYLSSMGKNWKQFLCSVWWLFVPYAVMETGYMLAASFLPVREDVGTLSLMTVLARIFIDPVGPYWYLHTLLICRIIHYTTVSLTKERLSPLSLLIVLGIVYWMLSEGLNLMNFGFAMYFLMGVGVRKSKVDFLTLFQPSLWSIIPFILLCCRQDNLLGFKLSGIIITYLAVSLSLWIYPKLPEKVRKTSHVIGRNTLILLLFSPLFTMLSRIYQPLFTFDSSGGVFALFTIAITISGCFAIAWCMDKCRLSRWFFGKERILTI